MSNWPSGINPCVPTVRVLSQSFGATAVAVSGVTQLGLMMDKTNVMWLTCETASIRYRWDGSSPTSSTGHLLPVNTPLKISGVNRICNFRFIGAAGASGTATITLDNSASAGGLV